MLTVFTSLIRRFAAPLAAMAMVSVLFGAASVSAAPVSQENPPERPSCEDRCQDAYDRMMEACEARGGENCEERAQAALDKCLDRCENGAGPREPRGPREPGERPEPPSCEERCEAKIERATRFCEQIEDPERQAACEERLAKLIENCETRCENPPERPGAADCATGCAERAAQVEQRCVDNERILLRKGPAPSGSVQAQQRPSLSWPSA